jgi:hypothetical protein
MSSGLERKQWLDNKQAVRLRRGWEGNFPPRFQKSTWSDQFSNYAKRVAKALDIFGRLTYLLIWDNLWAGMDLEGLGGE